MYNTHTKAALVVLEYAIVVGHFIAMVWNVTIFIDEFAYLH
jgi:hypothetical protein